MIKNKKTFVMITHLHKVGKEVGIKPSDKATSCLKFHGTNAITSLRKFVTLSSAPTK